MPPGKLWLFLKTLYSGGLGSQIDDGKTHVVGLESDSGIRADLEQLTARSRLTKYGQGAVVNQGSTVIPGFQLCLRDLLGVRCRPLRRPGLHGSTEPEIAWGPPGIRRRDITWIHENGPRELELLLRAVLYHSSQPILIADNDRRCLDSTTLEQVEREHILRVLRETGGVVSTAAARLGMPRTTLNAMMRKLGITRKDF